MSPELCQKNRWMIVTVTLVGVVLMAWFGFGRVAYYDRQVRKLCAIDGGIKVYETVELTPDLLDKFGRISIPSESKATSSDLYFYKMKNQYLRKKNPTLIRISTVIIRSGDNKIIGESIRYVRGGGGLPGLWETSTYYCPPISKENLGIEKQIFIKGGE